MAKNGNRTRSDWSIGAHTVNSYKERVADPAYRRNRRTAKEIRRMIAQALNKVRNEGKTIYLTASNFKGKARPKTLYRVSLFKDVYYVLCIENQVVTLFSSEMIFNDARRGDLVFRDAAPFDELIPLMGAGNARN